MRYGRGNGMSAILSRKFFFHWGISFIEPLKENKEIACDLYIFSEYSSHLVICFLAGSPFTFAV